jgi:putative transposase
MKVSRMCIVELVVDEEVGYPKNIAQRNGNFDNVHAWTYGYLLRRISEVAEEYGIDVIYVDEAYTSSRCPIHGDGCGVRISRGLFKCTRLNKVFNADNPKPREG